MNEVTAGSPPTIRYSWVVPEHGLDFSFRLWVTLVPGGISWVHVGVTIAVRFGPLTPVPAPWTRLKPLHVVGTSVWLLPPAFGGGRCVSHPVVPGTCVPGAALSDTPHPKPTPTPSQVKNELAAPAFGAL